MLPFVGSMWIVGSIQPTQKAACRIMTIQPPCPHTLQQDDLQNTGFKVVLHAQPKFFLGPNPKLWGKLFVLP